VFSLQGNQYLDLKATPEVGAFMNPDYFNQTQPQHPQQQKSAAAPPTDYLNLARR